MRQTLPCMLAVVVACAMLPASCIKDEPLNTECDILSAWVDGDQYAPLFYQTSQMRKAAIASNDRSLVFTVRSVDQLPRQLPVSFTLTEGATIQPANGSPQDFTAGPVAYTVTSQDGQWQRHYTVEFREREAYRSALRFSFENVDTERDNTNNNSYHVFYETDHQGNRLDLWASGNPGVSLVHENWTPDRFTTRSTADGYEGRGVCLNTQYAGALGRMFGKPIAAGNLFIGKFNVNNVLLNPLRATEFGSPADRVPRRLSGYYKYSPGERFTDAAMNVVAGRTDEAHVYAVFFRNQAADGRSVVLYGNDVLSSPYILRKAELKAPPPTDEWTRFEIDFEGGDADPDVLASQGYSLTVVFASSKDGDAFEGAVGSTLWIDEVEVTFEDE